MRVRFQYSDHSEWEGRVEDAHQSPEDNWPDFGVIRMYAIDDGGRTTVFVYDDFYFIYKDGEDWVFGAGTPRRRFRYSVDGKVVSEEIPVKLPEGAVVRRGSTVSTEEAIKLNLIPAPGFTELSEKRFIPLESSKDKNCEGCSG